MISTTAYGGCDATRQAVLDSMQKWAKAKANRDAGFRLNYTGKPNWMPMDFTGLPDGSAIATMSDLARVARMPSTLTELMHALAWEMDSPRVFLGAYQAVHAGAHLMDGWWAFAAEEAAHFLTVQGMQTMGQQARGALQMIVTKQQEWLKLPRSNDAIHPMDKWVARGLDVESKWGSLAFMLVMGQRWSPDYLWADPVVGDHVARLHSALNNLPRLAVAA